MDTQDTLADVEFLQTGPSTSGRSDVELLRQALLNEKAAPEILQFETDLIHRAEQAIDYQEEQIDMMREQDQFKLVVDVLMAELVRVRYLLRAYYRARLAKIERFVMHILDNSDLEARLSEKERPYARDYFVLLGSHLKEMAAGKLPESFNSLVRQAAGHAQKDMVPAPDLDKHVFCRVLEDRGQVAVDDEGNMAEFNAGDLFVIRYRPLQPLVAEGSVALT